MEQEQNGQKLWFRNKRYGWGWVPATWQGWAVILLYAALAVACGLTIDDSSPPREIAFTFVLPVLLLTVALFRVCRRYGEKPEWRWGGKPLEPKDR